MSGASIPPDLIPYLLGQKKDYSSVQSSIITVNVIFVTLICLTTGLRFWVRFGMLRAAGLDDIFMIVALTFALLLSASCFVGHSFGLGKHIWNLSPILTELPAATGRVTKALYGCYLAYSTAMTFTKFSIMATYFRIFVPKGMLRKVVLAVAIIVLCFWITSIFAILFICIPVQAAWDYTIKGRCYPVVNFFYASSAFNLTTDLLLCFLPLPTLWALKMSTAQRIVLCVLFSGGTFACIASILRLTQLHHLGGLDVTYQTAGSLNWSVIEVDMAIICASISALRPLANRTLPKLFHHFSQASSTPAYNYGGPSKESKPSISQTSASRSSISKLPLQSPAKIPASKFSTLRAQEGRDTGWKRRSSNGEITVETTFDATELAELPPVMKILPMSPIAVTERKSSKRGAGLFTDTARLFEKSSEEDLNEPEDDGRDEKD